MENIIFDKKIRKNIRKSPKAMLGSKYIDKDINFIVKTNTNNTTYIIIPLHDNDLDLTNIHAAESISSAGTASTAGTVVSISSACSCSSTVSTIGTVSTAGTLAN